MHATVRTFKQEGISIVHPDHAQAFMLQNEFDLGIRQVQLLPPSRRPSPVTPADLMFDIAFALDVIIILCKRLFGF